MRVPRLALILSCLSLALVAQLQSAFAQDPDGTIKADPSTGLNVKSDDESSKTTFTLEWTQSTPIDARCHVWDYIGYISHTNRLVAVEVSSEGGSTRTNGSFTLWEFSDDGKTIHKSPLTKPPADRVIPPFPGLIAGIISLPDDEFLILGRFQDENTTSLIRLNRDRKIISSKPLTKQLLGSRFYQTVPFGEHNALLVGIQDEPIVVSLDFDGSIAWAKTYDRPKAMDWFTDVVVSENKSFVLAGQSGDFSKFGTGPSEVWILQCDPDGKVLNERLLPGRSPNIAGPLADGKVAVIYDLQTDMTSDQRVALLDNELATIWQKDAHISQTSVEHPSISKFSNEQFVMADISNKQLRVRQFDIRGNVVRLYQEKLKEKGGMAMGSVRVAVHGERVFVSTAILGSNTGVIYGLTSASD